MSPSSLLARDTTLIVLPWPEPEVESEGHDACGRYAELFVLPVLGPTAMQLFALTCPKIFTTDR